MKRLLFIVSEDWYFVSHRLYLGEAARKQGYQVGVLTRISKHRSRIESAGVRVFDWNLNRRSRNPLAELRAVRELVAALREFQPDLIHAVALKPVLYSSLAARLVGVQRRVFAMGGLGFVFASDQLSARLLRPIVVAALRLAFAGTRTQLILQNANDLQLLTAAKVAGATQIRLICGAGVDTQAFRPEPERNGPPLIVLPARMLWAKGIAEFVSCAIEAKRRGLNARFALVGEPDSHNPQCVPEAQLKQWSDAGIVEWWGRRDDMPAVFAEAHIVCLPSSYGEGLPKALLEAASCGRPIVTYDVPGCREVVEHGKNGLLVPLKDTERLVEAIIELVNDPALRKRMGAAGRHKVLAAFSQEQIFDDTLRVWQEVLA